MDSSFLRTCIALLFAFFSLHSFADNSPAFNLDEVKSRFETMDCIVKPRYTPIVESYIKGYLQRDLSRAERILGKAAIFFPIFEKYLKEHNLPQDLKYLAIVESALNPTATSRVGAEGLWQFMKETGRGYGLSIDNNVDERSCAYSSTEAAMQYLARQYERYGNWELALASYNCGSVLISNAIRKAGGSTDYWRVARFLPKETQYFIPAFLSAAYLVNFAHLHGVKPQFPGLDMQLTEAVKVFERINFTTIAAVAGLPVDIVAQLNPAFKNDFVPQNPAGHYVILPRRVMQAFKDYLELLRPDNGTASEAPLLPALVKPEDYMPEKYYYLSVYTIGEGDNIDELASLFSCTPYNLKAWNNLTSYNLARGTELSVWFPDELRRFHPSRKIEVLPVVTPEVVTIAEPKVPEAPALQMEQEASPVAVTLEVAVVAKPAAFFIPKKTPEKGVRYYQLRRNESLSDVASQFPGITVQHLLEWNCFSLENLPLPGARLKIRPGDLELGINAGH